jgi:hypothetical protein
MGTIPDDTSDEQGTVGGPAFRPMGPAFRLGEADLVEVVSSLTPTLCT